MSQNTDMTPILCQLKITIRELFRDCKTEIRLDIDHIHLTTFWENQSECINDYVIFSDGTNYMICHDDGNVQEIKRFTNFDQFILYMRVLKYQDCEAC